MRSTGAAGMPTTVVLGSLRRVKPDGSEAHHDCIVASEDQVDRYNLQERAQPAAVNI